MKKSCLTVSSLLLCGAIAASTVSADGPYNPVKKQHPAAATSNVASRPVHSGFYVRAGAAYPVSSKITGYTTKKRVSGNLAVGYDFDNHWSAEVQGVYMKTPFKSNPTAFSSKATSIGGFANLIYRHDLGAKITPFLGAGLGGIRNKTSQAKAPAGTPLLFNTRASSFKVAYQIFGGVDFSVNNNTDMFCDIKWANFGRVSANVPDHFSKPLTALLIGVGLKFKI